MDTTKIDQAFQNLYSSLDSYAEQVKIAKKARRRARIHIVGGVTVLVFGAIALAQENNK